MHELRDVTKFLIHAGEANVGHLVHRAEALHHGVADGGRRDFAVVLGFEHIDHVLDEHGDLLGIDGTLVAGGAHGADEFLAGKILAPAVALDD